MEPPLLAYLEPEFVYFDEGSDWSICPRCESPDIVGDRVFIEDMEAYQEIECNSCGKQWIEVYSACHREIPRDDDF